MTESKAKSTVSLSSLSEKLVDSLSQTKTWLIIIAVVMVAYAIYQMYLLWGAEGSWVEWILAALTGILGIVGIVIFWINPQPTAPLAKTGGHGKIRLSEL